MAALKNTGFLGRHAGISLEANGKGTEVLKGFLDQLAAGYLHIPLPAKIPAKNIQSLIAKKPSRSYKKMPGYPMPFPGN